MLLPLLLIVAADLTGLWYGPPTPEEESTKRDIYLALRVEGHRVSGEVETPTRNAPIAEGVCCPTAASGVLRRMSGTANPSGGHFRGISGGCANPANPGMAGWSDAFLSASTNFDYPRNPEAGAS